MSPEERNEQFSCNIWLEIRHKIFILEKSDRDIFASGNMLNAQGGNCEVYAIYSNMTRNASQTPRQTILP